MGDQIVNVDLAFHIPVDNLRHLGSASRATKRSAPPYPARHQLKRSGRNFGTGWSNTDDDALAPALVAAFKCLTHYLYITDALKTVICTSTSQLNELRH